MRASRTARPTNTRPQRKLRRRRGLGPVMDRVLGERFVPSYRKTDNAVLGIGFLAEVFLFELL